jgi:hypothetical protein
MDYQYTEAKVAPGYTPIANMPQAEKIKAAPSTPLVYGDLADAAKVLADASGRFIEARDALNEAQSRWANLNDQLSKFREQEGV